MSDIVNEVKASVEGLEGKVSAFIADSAKQVAEHGEVSAKTASQVEKLEGEVKAMSDALNDFSQSSADMESNQVKSLGEMVVASDAYAAFANASANRMRVEVQANTTTGSDVTVAPDRMSGVNPGAFRNLRISDVIPSGSTSSNSIEVTKELLWTNNAAETAEAGTKPESAITFELQTIPVRTIAHWLKVSKQVRDDAPALVSYINNRVAYGVEHRLDSQLINGDGVAPNLSGLLDTGNYTVYTAGAGDTAINNIREAIGLVEAADYAANAVILNPADVQAIDLTVGTDDHYIAADPRSNNQRTIWGLPIVTSNAIAANSFLVGAFDMATQLFSRQGVTVEIFEQNDTDVIENLLTIRGEMRAALAVYRPASIYGGTLTA